MNPGLYIRHTLHNRRAQLLLPAVLLLPLFVLVIYLLVEVTKVSIAKVRHQFALDNAAYTQMSSVSVFLNAVGLLNGPLPYRVMRTYTQEIEPVHENKKYRNKNKVTVFDVFFQAGAIPTLAPDYDWGQSPPPKADSTDWGVHYAKYDGIQTQYADSGGTDVEGDAYDRSGWEKETPEKVKEPVVINNYDIANNYYFPMIVGGKTSGTVAYEAFLAYLNTYMQVGDTFNLQKHLYQKVIKNAGMFREGYYLNVDDCKQNECARQSASKLLQYLSIPTKRYEIDSLIYYFSNSGMSGGSGGATALPWEMTKNEADPLFQFAYVEPVGRSRLKSLKRGITLKQNFPLPRNHFNVDLKTKYKPYVRNTVILNCPRANNNCVWPNPLPKYNVILRP